MDEESVGLRELKARLSAYIRRVKEGQAVLITEHGRPVGRIVPVGQSVEERLQDMARAGLLAWTGRRLGPFSRL